MILHFKSLERLLELVFISIDDSLYTPFGKCRRFPNIASTSLSHAVTFSDFIWPFLPPYMGVIPNPNMAFIFPISCILVLIFPISIVYFPKCEGKGSFPKSQIKSLTLHAPRPFQSTKNDPEVVILFCQKHLKVKSFSCL